MTPQEAVKWLKAIEEKYIHGGDEDFDENRKIAINTAICALKKQIPKKTTKRQYVPNGTLVYGHCPNCDCFTKNFFKYCGNCGQALDWSGTE